MRSKILNSPIKRKKSSIVWFIDHLGYGGTQQVLLRVSRKLARHGYMQTIICLNDVIDTNIRSQLTRLGIEVRVVGKKSLIFGTGLLSLWFWLRRRRFDVCVTLLFFSDIVGLPMAYVAGVPKLISSVRARNANYTAWQNIVLRRALRLADHVVTNTIVLNDYVIDDLWVSEEKLVVIANPVAEGGDDELMGDEVFRRQFNILPGVTVIGTCGRLSMQKGFDILFKAMSILKAMPLSLIIFGEGREEEKLIGIAESLGIREKVQFAGHREDARNLFRNLDLYVQPSRFEGVPNAMLEAMSVGCPVVGAAVDGIVEILEDERYGWLVLPESPEELASTITKVCNAEVEAKRRALRAEVKVKSMCNEEKIVRQWEDLFD